MTNKCLYLLLLAILLSSCAPEQNGTANNERNTSDRPLKDSSIVNASIDTAELLPAVSLSLDSSLYKFEDGAIRVTWKMLSDVVFTDEYSEEVEAYVPYPTFGTKLQAIEGKTILIEGYIIPLEETGDETILVLSALPYSSCFFCGGAGPESVMDIKLRPEVKRKFTTDERMTFRGKLRLNDDDLYFLNYILEEAEIAL